MTKKALSSQAAFLDKVRKSKATVKKTNVKTLKKALEPGLKPRLLFSMDATASREASWEVAKKITGEMFKAMPGELDIALAYHGGSALQEMSKFSSNARVFLDKINLVECHAGVTALNDILRAAIDIEGLRALCYTGDCYEECEDEAYKLAKLLKLKNVKCFFFHDDSSNGFGYSTTHAKDVFQNIVDITGGIVLPFNEHAPNEVKEPLKAIAVYAAGGVRALEHKKESLPGAEQLLEVL